MLHKAKTVLKGEEARNKLVEGFEYLNNAVKTSLGPSGRNTIFRDNGLFTKSTKDGITIMKSINAPTEDVQYGVDILREASFKTVAEAGDGTTSTSIIATEITRLGVEKLSKVELGFWNRLFNNNSTPTLSPIGIKAGIDKATTAIIEEIKNRSIKVDKETLRHVATIAANNDKFIGELVADAVYEVTSKGDVLIERSPNFKTYTNIEPGTKYPKGYAHHSLVNNPSERTTEFENAYILISMDDMVRVEDFQQILATLIQHDPKASLLVVAPQIIGNVMTFLTQNNHAEESPMRGRLCGIQAPALAEYQGNVLEDMALLTGATIIGETIGKKPEDCDWKVLGKAEKIKVTIDSTLIVNPTPTNEEALKERVSYLDGKVKETQGDEKEIYLQRLAYLNGKAAVIYVGGNSDVETNEKKDRIDDAVASAKAALDEGIVPGSGVTYLTASKIEVKVDNESEQIGVDIVKEALQKPFHQVLENADFEIYTPTNLLGYNIKTGEHGDLITLGVVDATRVLTSSIKNAASVAGTVLLTEILVYETND